jgi:hypothetical protein
MKQKLPFLILTLLLFASCSTTRNTIQNNDAAYSQKTHLTDEDINREFISNLILLYRYNPSILNAFAYTYNAADNRFFDVYYTPSPSSFTRQSHLYYDAYSKSYIRIDEEVLQKVGPSLPAPAGFQTNNIQINNSKYLPPVPIAHDSHYVNGSSIDYSTGNKTNTNVPANNSTSQNTGNNANERRYVNSQASKFENVNQPVKTYTPAYADNNNYQNNNQSYNGTSNNSQDNNTGNTKNKQGNMPPR